MTLQPMQKVYWEITPSLGPTTDARITLQYGRYGLEIQVIFFSEEGSKSWVVISRAFSDTLRKFRQDAMSPWTEKPSPCSTERTVEETTLATRSTGPARYSGKSTTNSSHKLIQMSCSRWKKLVFSSNWSLEGFHASTDDIASTKWIPSEESSNESYFYGVSAGMIPMADW